jgi:hypothetical protein
MERLTDQQLRTFYQTNDCQDKMCGFKYVHRHIRNNLTIEEEMKLLKHRISDLEIKNEEMKKNFRHFSEL